jgi:CHASE3 domain sensor protein
MIPIQHVRKTVLWLGAVSPLAALVATIWVAHKTNGQFDTAFAAVTHTYKVLNILEATQAHVADAETGQRGYQLTHREDYFTLYDAAMASVNNDIQQLKILILDSSIQETNLNQLQKLVGERLAPSAAMAAGKGRNLDEIAVALTDEGRDTMNQIRGVLFRMREQETDSLVVRQQDAEARFLFDQTALFVLIGITAIALIAIVAVLFRLEHLRQIVTVCAWTGQVKHEGEWIRLEDYLKLRFGLSVSHGLSKEAAEKMTQEMRHAKAPPSPT